MNDSTLYGIQYVRLAPGAAERVAPYLGVPAQEIRELVLELDVWPEDIQRSPLRGWDGRLIEGDPVLLDATETGLLFAGRSPSPQGKVEGGVLVRWQQIESLQVLGAPLPPTSAPHDEEKIIPAQR